MKDRFDPKSPLERNLYAFTDRYGEVIELHLMTQKRTQVASIEFTHQAQQISIPYGIIVTINDPYKGVVSFHITGMGRVIWFNAKHQFRVQYFGKQLFEETPL